MYIYSDALVEEAAGGKSNAKLLMETDEKGFRDSEVTDVASRERICFSFSLS